MARDTRLLRSGAQRAWRVQLHVHRAQLCVHEPHQRPQLSGAADARQQRRVRRVHRVPVDALHARVVEAVAHQPPSVDEARAPLRLRQHAQHHLAQPQPIAVAQLESAVAVGVSDMQGVGDLHQHTLAVGGDGKAPADVRREDRWLEAAALPRLCELDAQQLLVGLAPQQQPLPRRHRHTRVRAGRHGHAV